MDCLARFAVPFFFLVSGYYAYQAKDTVMAKRMISMVKLNIQASFVYLLWGMWYERYVLFHGRAAWLKERFSALELSKWLVIGENPFSFHLWYLTAMCVCTFVCYLYVRWWEEKPIRYQPLYFLGIVLCVVHILQGSVITAAGSWAPNLTYRNALFFGMPIFILGVFLHEYQDKILRVYRLTKTKLLLILLAGVGLSLLQWLGTGPVEMPLGTLFEVIALMLLLISTPRITKRSSPLVEYMISGCNRLAVYIYIMHPIARAVYNVFFSQYFRNFGNVVPYLETIGVVVISLSSGIIWYLVMDAAKRMIKGK